MKFPSACGQTSYLVGVLSAYGHWIEDRDVAAASSRTVGLHWTGQGPEAVVRWGLTLEAAQQHGISGGAGKLATLHAFNGWADLPDAPLPAALTTCMPAHRASDLSWPNPIARTIEGHLGLGVI